MTATPFRDTTWTGETLNPQKPLCDLVMKGGITSGVVYPKLIYELSQRYQFKSIGGTSAGAIAAGACAAAEYGRQNGQTCSFERLKQLPEELGETVAPGKRSRLLSLFQPSPDLRQHFDVLLQVLNKKPHSAIIDMLIRMLTGKIVAVLALLLIGAVLLGPLIQSLSGNVNFWMATGTSLCALVLVGTALWRCAAASAVSRFSMLLACVGIYLLLVIGLKLVSGLAWHCALFGIGLSLLACAVLTWAFILSLVGFLFARSLLAGLHRNRYGFCSGRTMPTPPDSESTSPGLTDWLTTYFDDLAGLKQREHPLTFGDLWGGDLQKERNINLEVMTSAVSQHMIYGIPFREGMPPLCYDPEELKDYFPKRVMDWLARTAVRADMQCGIAPEAYAPDTNIQVGEGTNARVLHRLPHGADLPVVVAGRMSLSIPLLLAAIPLYAVDVSRKGNQLEIDRVRAAKKAGEPAKATLQATRIWFSDGGIGSNIPLHMFDALLPGHPTFAINLKAKHPDIEIKTPEIQDNQSGRIYLPENGGGHLRPWTSPKDEKPLPGLAGFLVSILNTMQNWRDEIQFTYPSFKDRIVQISLRENEGGLNLDMPKETIAALGNAGSMAAHRLINRFHPDGAQNGQGWTKHQKTRLATFLGTMQPGSAALYKTTPVERWTQLASRIDYTQAQMALAKDFLTELDKLGSLGAAQKLSLECAAPKPVAQIRISPKI